MDTGFRGPNSGFENDPRFATARSARDVEPAAAGALGLLVLMQDALGTNISTISLRIVLAH